MAVSDLSERFFELLFKVSKVLVCESPLGALGDLEEEEEFAHRSQTIPPPGIFFAVSFQTFAKKIS